MIFDLINSRNLNKPNPLVMVDARANSDESFETCLGSGWRVHAFEPDPERRKQLSEIHGENSSLSVSPHAISLSDGDLVALSGSSGSNSVRTTRIDTYLRTRGIEEVDFLKIDNKGDGYFALQTFPFEELLPSAVLVGYDDLKTVPRGYSAHDIATFMAQAGLNIWVSEWHPIARRATEPDWCRMVRYEISLELSSSWGNLLGFREDVVDDAMADALALRLQFGAKTDNGVTSVARPKSRNNSMSVRVVKSFVRLVSKVSERRASQLYRAFRGGYRKMKKIS